MQARAIPASARPRDPVRKALKRLALEQLAEMVVMEKKIKASSKELKTLVIARGSHTPRTLQTALDISPYFRPRHPAA